MKFENDSYIQEKIKERMNFGISIKEIVDSVASDYVLYNVGMLLNTLSENISIETFSSNIYFKKICSYLKKEDLKFKYKNSISIEIPWYEISNKTNLKNIEIILYTLKKLPNHIQFNIYEYINLAEEYIKEYNSKNELPKEKSLKTEVNADGTYTVDGIKYKNKEVYMNFLLDKNAEKNHCIFNGIIYPIKDIDEKLKNSDEKYSARLK